MVKKSGSKKLFPFSIELDREKDVRWIAEIPGAIAYGNTKQQAVRKVYAIALRTFADSIEQGSTPVAGSWL